MVVDVVKMQVERVPFAVGVCPARVHRDRHVVRAVTLEHHLAHIGVGDPPLARSAPDHQGVVCILVAQNRGSGRRVHPEPHPQRPGLCRPARRVERRSERPEHRAQRDVVRRRGRRVDEPRAYVVSVEGLGRDVARAPVLRRAGVHGRSGTHDVRHRALSKAGVVDRVERGDHLGVRRLFKGQAHKAAPGWGHVGGVGVNERGDCVPVRAKIGVGRIGGREDIHVGHARPVLVVPAVGDRGGHLVLDREPERVRNIGPVGVSVYAQRERRERLLAGCRVDVGTPFLDLRTSGPDVLQAGRARNPVSVHPIRQVGPPRAHARTVHIVGLGVHDRASARERHETAHVVRTL